MATISTAPPQKQKESWGCWGCGCGLLVLVVILGIALAGWSGYFTVHKLTDAAATEIPQHDSGDTVYRTASQKITDFEDALEQSRPSALHLDSDEINTIIARDPDYAKIRGHLFIKLDGDHADIQASLPLGMFEKVAFADRYLNGTATLGISFDSQDKSLDVDLRHLALKGTEFPANSVASFSQSINTTLNSKLQAEPGAREFLNRVQKISIENGELVIETK